MDKFVSRKEVLKVLGIHYHTLYSMIERGDIEYINTGTRYLFNLDKYLVDKGVKNNCKKYICYCRVSSQHQKEDLERQIKFMKERYPTYEIISDIGSGLNFKRKGLTKVIELAISGHLCELVVAYKDRLARFGYDLIENLIKTYSKGKITIVNNKEKEKTPMDEVAEDILAIMNIYTAKMNGLRKYKKNIEVELKEHLNKNEIKVNNE